MKLGSVTKLNKRNKAMSKKIEDDMMSTDFDVIIIFPIYCQSGAIWKPHSGHIVCKIYIFIKINLLSYKN